MKRYDEAYYLKDRGYCNCAQAVCKAYSDIVKIDEEELIKLTSGFGQGMGSLEATCGALIGANIILGLANDKDISTKAISRKMVADFKEKCGATICKDLKGVETRIVLCPCSDCVKNASIILEKHLIENDIIKEEVLNEER